MAEGERKQVAKHDVAEILSGSMYGSLFPPHLELVPQVNEVYELELAHLESQVLGDEGIIRNGAYFARVGDVLTRHFLMCSGEPVRLPQHSSSRLRSFFTSKQFKTGYGTHGLFPYRGKFHPQMIKGILNVMGLKPGDTVLDPMMGSGTVLIEASLMGIHSVGVDASPFCQFMAQAKLDGLRIPLDPVRAALADSESAFAHFTQVAGQPCESGGSHSRPVSETLFSVVAADDAGSRNAAKAALPEGCDAEKVYGFLLLAYLDSAGYAQRSQRKTPYEQFRAILERYLFVTEKIQQVLAGAEDELGTAQSLEGDARQLTLEDGSVDGIVFSPPYSFAIDYLENDAFHLGSMGVDLGQLRQKMIGLRGTTRPSRFESYKADMAGVLSECSRVLKPGRICTIIVGTNNNQLSKILGVPTEQVQGIDELLIELGSDRDLQLVRKMERQITGMANTMRTEFIVMLRRT